MIGGAEKAVEFYQWSGDMMAQILIYGFGFVTFIAMIWFIRKTKKKSSQK